MKTRKLGPFLLSGLMIGPILGSGIIILPPLVYQTAGSWAFPAWCLIVLFGFFFARIFGKLTIMFPGEAGISLAVEKAFGERAKKLTAFYLMGAVLFGPVAVMLTAAEYIPVDLPVPVTAAIIVLSSSILLLRETAFIGKVAFFLSTFAAISLLLGSFFTISDGASPEVFTLTSFSSSTFGYTMLLLFWTIVGWEVVGNYSADVDNPDKTIMRAVNFSFCAIAIVSLMVAAAVQVISSQPETEAKELVTLLYPIYGSYSSSIMSLLTLSLCITTYLMFVGGVARLMASFAQSGYLPKILNVRTGTGSPVGATVFLTVFFLIVLGATYLGLIDTAKLVALADGFFLANALIGLFAAAKLLTEMTMKLAASVLSLIFLVILSHSSIAVLVVIGLLIPWVFRQKATPLRASLDST